METTTQTQNVNLVTVKRSIKKDKDSSSVNVSWTFDFEDATDEQVRSWAIDALVVRIQGQARADKAGLGAYTERTFKVSEINRQERGAAPVKHAAKAIAKLDHAQLAAILAERGIVLPGQAEAEANDSLNGLTPAGKAQAAKTRTRKTNANANA